MSGAEHKAVFLSYASQDAEAALRLCSALRAVGVEVWFDQSELVGGDSWDAKIRGRISSCGLFVPLISANTQARLEGYFRLEWKLAAQRTHTMADEKTFLLPVVIDATRDAEAKVPAEFKTVQWTKLLLRPAQDLRPADGALEKFCARVKQLLTGEVAPASSRQSDEAGKMPALPRKQSSRPWLGLAIAGVAVLAAGVGYFALRPRLHSEEPAKAAAAPAVAVLAQPLSEAGKLERQARALIDDDPLRVRENFRTACELCERATTLSPDDADAWATYARASCVLIADYNERGDKAIAAARLRAERAIRLAPDSLEANLAKAQYAIQVGGDGATGERQLRALLERAPNDRRILRALARAAGELVDRQPEKLAESRQWAERAEALPGGDTLALTELGWGYWGLNRFQELDALLDRVLTRQPTSDAYHLKVMVLMAWGDMDGVLHWLEKIPPAVLSEDRVAAVAIETYLFKRQPEKALALLARLPREFLEEGRYFTPKSYLAGLALRMAGKLRAAEIEFRSALKTAEDRIAAKPNDARLFNWKGRLLAQLGDRAGAAREYETGRELGSINSDMLAPADLTLLGRYDEAIAGIDARLQRGRSRWPSFFSQLKFSQDFDPLRDDARFVALIARGDGWLREMRSPPATSVGAATIAPAGDDKSVAVLAFANLSDDKANEYFSDGISEELLNVLAKVPKLKVAARTSSFYFKGRNEPIPEIAQKLGVAYVVEGSVRKAGDKVRITAQLIKAADGFHIWSETYDRELKDIFAVQDEIAKKILTAVKGSLMGEAELPHAAPTKIEAYTLYLQAQGAFAKRGDANLREAIRLFEAALAIDSNYVPALVGLGQARALVPLYANLNGAKAREMIDSAMTAAKRALELDARNPAAHAVIGWLLVQYEWKWSEGEAAVLRALELAPNDAWIWNSLGDHYRFVGEFAKAIAAKQRAWELDPLSPVSQWDLGYANLVAGNFDLALHWSEVGVGLAPHNLDSYTPGIMAACQAGRTELMRKLVTAARQNVHENEGLLLLLEARTAIQEKKSDEARRLLAKATPLAETGDTTPAYIGYCYLLLGDSDQAARWLQRAYDLRDPALVWNEIIDLDVIAANPKTRPILDRPGIKELYELRQRNARAVGKKP